MRRKVPKSLNKVNRITDAIAREYKKATPDREKIARLSVRAGKILRRIKNR